MRKHKQNFIPIIVALILIVVVLAVSLASGFFEDISEGSADADLNSFFGISSQSEAAIIYNKNLIPEKALYSNGIFYLPMSMANEMNDIFYFDSVENRLFATTGTAVYEAGASDFTLNGEQLYISTEFLKNFANFSSVTASDPARIMIQTQWSEKNTAIVSKKTSLHTESDKKSPVTKNLQEGDSVEILSSNELYSYCVTDDIIFGFIENKRLSGHETRPEAAVNSIPPMTYPTVRMEGSVVLGWHNVTNETANSMIGDVLSSAHGMNVISPTWFSLADNDGNISSLASSDYVNTAHAAGVKVWGLIDNFNNETDTNTILSSTTKRRNLENNIINTALQYGLDGINIDFEQLPTEAGDDFAQFLRELSILCHTNNLVLSTDNYVPKEYTNYYRRDIQGKVCDYVIIMGYDEHTSLSDEPGSVASIGFVTEGIVNTLKDVPAEKVINGIPFYTRLWSLDNGILDSSVLGMADAATTLKDNGVTAQWDNVTCQNTASYEKNGASYSIWLEDSQSISAKLSVMKNNNLAGVACWRLMLETPDIWDVISAYYPAAPAAAATEEGST